GKAGQGGQIGRKVRPDLLEQQCAVARKVVDVLQRGRDRAAVGRETGHESLQLEDELVETRIALLNRAEHLDQVVDDTADDGVAVSNSVGQTCGLGGEVGDRSALTLERLDDLQRERVD